jgi:hypothetical protein
MVEPFVWQSEALAGSGSCRGPRRQSTRSGSLTGNRTAEFRPANISWLCLDSLSPSWVRQPSTTASARLQEDFVRPRSHPLARSHQRRPLARYRCSVEPEIGSSSRPRELSDDRAQLSDEAHQVVTPLLSEHRQQPDSLSRTLLDDETLGAPADARPPEWRRLPRGRTHRKPSRALMTPLRPPVEFRCRDRRGPCRRVAPRPERAEAEAPPALNGAGYLRVDCDGWPTFDRLGDFAVGRSSSFVDQRGGCRCDVRGVNAGGGQ